MDRCIGCRGAHGLMVLGGDSWCGPCVSSGQYASFVEAKALVDAIVAERARRIPTPRDDKRFKPAEQRYD